MGEFFTIAMTWLQPLADVLGWAVVFATAFMRLPFMKVDPTKFDGISSWILKALQWLPTVGVNPMTKEVEAAKAAIEAKP